MMHQFLQERYKDCHGCFESDAAIETADVVLMIDLSFRNRIRYSDTELFSVSVKPMLSEKGNAEFQSSATLCILFFY